MQYALRPLHVMLVSNLLGFLEWTPCNTPLSHSRTFSGSRVDIFCYFYLFKSVIAELSRTEFFGGYNGDFCGILHGSGLALCFAELDTGR